MTDRELLELAAKAVGMKIHTKNQSERDEMGFGDKGLWIIGGSSRWNPLTDDGDALRLAVKLGLTINITGMFVHADCCNRDDDIGYFEENSARNDGCILKAARRVIVRAAAAIGELINDHAHGS